MSSCFLTICRSSQCFLVTWDSNACCTNWWKHNIPNSTGRETDFLTSSGYTKIIDKPTYVKNNSMLCNDLIFCTNQKVISEHSADASIFDKCHTNISLIARLTAAYPSHQKYGATVKQILKISKNLSKTLIGIKLMNPFLQIKKLEF